MQHFIARMKNPGSPQHPAARVEPDNARGRIAAFSGPSLALPQVLQHNCHEPLGESLASAMESPGALCNMTCDLRQGGRAAGITEPAMRLRGIITWSKTVSARPLHMNGPQCPA
ncbi:hypothetical protein HaLaN_19521 [Haematococcus lacustris]|uniref:Uncharacterized protein n=1 Tax=Haematococcus lacustris TaxID=44745 RepID=A0A699ZUZ0_HAELA|nr:hypothetical protein HaLaN_19521 [Haematococcus lacustris]